MIGEKYMTMKFSKIIILQLCRLKISLTLVTWEFRTVMYVLPFRKKRKKSELSNEEKRYNRKHSKLRVIVEHTVSRVKKFGIMGTKFRNKLVRYDHASDIVSVLVDFRIIMRTAKALL
jgi:ppGpp synthetase/RelA/SpoT-type nucleotidyltranferase